MPLLLLWALLTAATGTARLAAQQLGDTLFRPVVSEAAYPPGSGPRVLFDAAHGNAELADGGYRPFLDLLRRDGFRVALLDGPFTPAALANADILVIINAQAPEKAHDWSLPTPPALAADEAAAVADWVHAGGALLLVADHMPFPGAMEELGRALGVEFMNGFAIDTVTWRALVFRRSDATLRAHPIADGRGGVERIDSVATFWGQAFRALDERVEELLVFAPGVVSLNPDTAWRFSESTPVVPVGGWLQGAIVHYGAGRAVILGEAGMLSAQFAGERRQPMGMNARVASQNGQYTLNVLRWLAGLYDDPPRPPQPAPPNPRRLP
jgi:hypothetical protein